MRMKHTFFSGLVGLCSLSLALSLQGSTQPHSISGVLFGEDGDPVADATYQFEAGIGNADGTLVWPENGFPYGPFNVPVVGGRYSFILDVDTSVWGHEELYLFLWADNKSLGASPITVMPLASFSQVSDTAHTAHNVSNDTVGTAQLSPNLRASLASASDAASSASTLAASAVSRVAEVQATLAEHKVLLDALKDSSGGGVDQSLAIAQLEEEVTQLQTQVTDAETLLGTTRTQLVNVLDEVGAMRVLVGSYHARISQLEEGSGLVVPTPFYPTLSMEEHLLRLRTNTFFQYILPINHATTVEVLTDLPEGLTMAGFGNLIWLDPAPAQSGWHIVGISAINAIAETTAKWNLRFLVIPQAMEYVEGGVNVIGSLLNQNAPPEQVPAHAVEISPFFMGQHEVSREVWNTAIAAAQADDVAFAGLELQSGPVHLPVTGVTWYQVVAFCNLLSKLHELDAVYVLPNGTAYLDATQTDVALTAHTELSGYRLPTNAEWEFAALNHTQQLYPWGDSVPSIPRTNAGNFQSVLVGAYPADVDAVQIAYPLQGAGFYHLSGNVREWCWDGFDVNYYANAYNGLSGVLQDPQGPAVTNLRTVRGSAYDGGLSQTLNAHRMGMSPTHSAPNLGFRLVRTVIQH